MRKVLVVDDEKRMLDLLTLYLEPHGYQCIKTMTAHIALDVLLREPIDLVLLDVMMPEMDGWELCREIRRLSDVPIIMLTARDQRQDMVKGLKLGADDYITKPFYEEELLARMEALLRRTRPANRIDAGGLVWNEDQFELSYNGRMIRLTRKEFLMLGLLMKHPGKVFSREQLLEQVWGYDSETEGRTVDSHVRNIREKVRLAGFPIDQYFTTVWGVGYKWINEPS